MKIKTIIIAIICIILPCTGNSAATTGDCQNKSEVDCKNTAGCAWGGTAATQGAPTCHLCPSGYYCQNGIQTVCFHPDGIATYVQGPNGFTSLEYCSNAFKFKEGECGEGKTGYITYTTDGGSYLIQYHDCNASIGNEIPCNSKLTDLLNGTYSPDNQCIKKDTTCSAGQYLEKETSLCKPCPAGTFQPGVDGGYVGNACHFCDEGTYQSESGKSECLECEPGSIAPKLGTQECTRCNTSTTKGTNDKRTTCICQTGFHDPEGPNSDYETQTESCTAIAYYVNYEPNCQSDKLDTKQSENSYTINETITYQDDIFTCPGYNFSGWKDQNGITYTQNILVSDVITDETEYIKLTAQWEVKTFDVDYNSGDKNATGEAPDTPETCRYGETCKAPDNTYMRAGYIFANWSCQYLKQAGESLKPCRKTGCGTGTCEISPGDDISTISDGNYIALTAIWAPCPNGYYCPGTDPNPKTEPQACPAGSTTDAGEDSIYDCHMVGGTTRICGDNGCFDLPKGVGELFYRVEKEN